LNEGEDEWSEGYIEVWCGESDGGEFVVAGVVGADDFDVAAEVWAGDNLI